MSVSTIAVVVKLLPIISDVVKSVEARSVEAKAKGEATFTGEYKLALAKTILRDAYNTTYPDATFKFDDIADVVESTIHTVVSLYNAIGVFKRS